MVMSFVADASSCLDSLPPSAYTSARFAIPPGALSADESYTLEVTVSSAVVGDERRASARTSVMIASAPVPLVRT